MVAEAMRDEEESARRFVAVDGPAAERREFKVDDDATAAGVVRDAVTVFVHPAHVEAAVKAGLPAETMARNVIRSLVAAFRAGMQYRQVGSER